ncbi:hypothetical protein M407DRAFT_241865 [Tulasnella calospora MUT 4182]|uniref:Uncharacterized protein n=1 Tax=Tulasnella calospora MUT 4182 TaxID=1051891 RepID=A0A0C3MCA6_9AGAM|nr:hypothetical protein M407DRAFT_241865 [Tulasnella calospora MUT 4182]
MKIVAGPFDESVSQKHTRAHVRASRSQAEGGTAWKFFFPRILIPSRAIMGMILLETIRATTHVPQRVYQ